MIIVTGAAGFIGSAIVWQLNQQGISDIIVADKMRDQNKWKNLVKLKYYDWVDQEDLFDYLSHEENARAIRAIVHMGACSATTEKNVDFLMKNNFKYTMKLWQFATERQIQFIYASSAATYGAGELGYDDCHETLSQLRPLNPYGYSKQLFDEWALKQSLTPSKWQGLKFFNVYGPQEYHKERMASVIFHAFNQTREKGFVSLFKSYREGIEHGGQLRDFVYIKDITAVIAYMLTHEVENGLYNLGSGAARSFYDLAKNTMQAMGQSVDIRFIEMPEDIRDKYQYFTQASIEKLKRNGYTTPFHTLEEGILDYVTNYLMKEDAYL